MKQLRYLKSAYETSQSLSTLTWPPNTLYRFEIPRPQRKREVKLRSGKQLSTYSTVVEGGQPTSRNLILTVSSQDNETSRNAARQKVISNRFQSFLSRSTFPNSLQKLFAGLHA